MTSQDFANGSDLLSPSVLQNRNYRHFLISRTCSSLAFQSLTVAMGWMIYEITGSAWMLGWVGFFQFLPMLILTFVVGAMADRYDRRRIGLICQWVEALTVLVLGVLVWKQSLTPQGILVAVTILGAAQAFERPTMASLLPGIVGPAMLQRAIATSTSFMQTALIVGPALGGVLYGFGHIVPFFVSGLLFLAAGYSVGTIRILSAAPTARTPVTFETIFAGVAFIRRTPAVLGMISLDLFAVLLGGATALLPIYASDILEAGPFGLGLLRSAPAIGALAMSIYLGRYPVVAGAGRKMFAAVAVFGLATIVFALSTQVWLSILALLVVGASDNISVVVRSSLVQLMTPDEMRGRVNAVNSLFIGTSNQLGEFESGMMAGFLGPVTACVIGGVGTLAVVAIWMSAFPVLRRIERLDGK
ncbi:MFS transporter [Paracoccus aminophilus]|uniref:Major facilitator superfamily MFS-1 n=1 Tax=Paracoccus aminophilus JCM 7686 TaxID=1367847 RepID=S5YI64_PARAH|nr:MFS transporter [Paracoccus aminophilus]AGT11168.1 major facilitator superfamily MFS-1 [Paracoccus aminophilus JCM 7686]